MQESPNEPGDKPTHTKAPALQYREILANDRHVALIKVSERMFWLSSLELPRDQASHIAALLNRRLRHARHWPSVALDRRRIAHNEHASDIWKIHERANWYSAGPIRLGTKQLHNGRHRDACGPQHRRAWNSISIGNHAVLVDLFHLGAGHDHDAEFFEPPGRLFGQPLRKRRKNSLAALDQNDRGLRGINPLELSA